MVDDLHYLHSPKEKELLVLLRYFERYDIVTSQLNDNIFKDFSNMTVRESLKHDIIERGLIDLLKTRKYTFDNSDFALACKNNQKCIAEYIFENGEIDNDQSNIFNVICMNGDLEIITWMYEFSKKSTMTIDIATDTFSNSCFSNKLDLVKYIWNHCTFDGKKIYIRETLPRLFAFICRKVDGNLDLLKWIYQLSVQEDIEMYMSKADFDRCQP